MGCLNNCWFCLLVDQVGNIFKKSETLHEIGKYHFSQKSAASSMTAKIVNIWSITIRSLCYLGQKNHCWDYSNRKIFSGQTKWPHKIITILLQYKRLGLVRSTLLPPSRSWWFFLVLTLLILMNFFMIIPGMTPSSSGQLNQVSVSFVKREWQKRVVLMTQPGFFEHMGIFETFAS